MSNPFKSNESIELSTIIIEPDSWGCLTEGYFWSAKLLLEKIIESDKFQNRWVAYPILFNIRHYYELSLKDILVNLNYIYNDEFLIKSHKLDDLIDKVSEISNKYFHENKVRLGYRLLVEDIENSIFIIKKEMEDFIKYDNDSFSFRYPYSKTGDAAIVETIKFDVRKTYNSLINCRKQLTNIATQLLCDDNNPIFKDNKKKEKNS